MYHGSAINNSRRGFYTECTGGKLSLIDSNKRDIDGIFPGSTHILLTILTADEVRRSDDDDKLDVRVRQEKRAVRILDLHHLEDRFGPVLIHSKVSALSKMIIDAIRK